MKWKRVRPGLYRVLNDRGDPIAEVERGAETRWWWVAAWDGEDWVCDRWATLKYAKRDADGILARAQ